SAGRRTAGRVEGVHREPGREPRELSRATAAASLHREWRGREDERRDGGAADEGGGGALERGDGGQSGGAEDAVAQPWLGPVLGPAGGAALGCPVSPALLRANQFLKRCTTVTAARRRSSARRQPARLSLATCDRGAQAAPSLKAE